MKRNILLLAMSVLPMAAALGSYMIDPSRTQFYFEDETEPRLNTQDDWYDIYRNGGSAELSNPGDMPVMEAGKDYSYRVDMASAYKTVKGWGLSKGNDSPTSGLIADAVWNYNGSTNCTFNYDNSYDGSIAYLYLHLRWFRYNIVFDSNGGAPIPPAKNNICYTNSVELSAPTLAGYDFVGWTNATVAATFGPVTGADLGVSQDGQDVTLAAKWTPKEYLVTFDPCGGTVSPQSKYVAYKSTYGDLPVPEWTGHAFDGWFTDSTYGSKIVFSSVMENTAAHTLYAHWHNLIDVRFVFLDSAGNPTNEVKWVEHGDSATAPELPYREGFNCTGWDGYFDNVTSSTTVHALYATNTYTVIYDPNGGDGSMTNDTATYWTEFNLQPNGFLRAVHDFCGWSTDPGATTNDDLYGDCALVSNLTAEANGEYTLYAIWASVITPYSIAADCSNLVLKCEGADKWAIDDSDGYASTSSVYAAGDVAAPMIAAIVGPGTLTFRYKAVYESGGPILDHTHFDFYYYDPDKPGSFKWSTADIANKAKSADGQWDLGFYTKTDSGSVLYRWLFAGVGSSDNVHMDQVHWYPRRFVTIYDPYGNYDNGVKLECREAMLSHWNDILGDAAGTVTNIVAKGSSITNVVELLRLGVGPSSNEVDGVTATVWYDNVEVPADIADAQVGLEFISRAYTGSAIEPQVAVSYGTDALVENTHYTVSYSDNVNAGTATVKISGIVAGGYGGTCTTNFTIAKAAYDMSSAAWNYAGAFTYDGTMKTVLVTGLPAGVTASYTGNTATEPGTNTAHAILAYDTVNHTAPAPVADLVWVINPSSGGGGGGGGEGGGDEGGGGDSGGEGGDDEFISGTLNGGFSRAQTVSGVLYDADGIAGTIQFKAGKRGGKGVKLSATATLMNGKKISAKPVTRPMQADGTMTGVLVFKAPLLDMEFSMAANGEFKLANGSYAMVDDVAGGKLADGKAVFSAEADPNPTLDAGFEILEIALPTNVVIAVSGGKKMNAGKAPSIKYRKVKDPDGTSKYVLYGFSDAKPNLSALKLSYTQSTGLLKGSFKVYATNEGSVAPGTKPKLKSYTAKVTGFVIDQGKGQTAAGYATVTKLSAKPWAISIRWK